MGPETDYNIGLFQSDAKAAIDDIALRKKIPILCGGSGLYVNSLINSSYHLGRANANPSQRRKWLEKEKAEGEGTLHRILTERFPIGPQRSILMIINVFLRALEMDRDLPQDDQYDLWESPMIFPYGV